jgi:hypothetical protein
VPKQRGYLCHDQQADERVQTDIKTAARIGLMSGVQAGTSTPGARWRNEHRTRIHAGRCEFGDSAKRKCGNCGWEFGVIPTGCRI